jgi:hypothetical protein
VEYRDSQSSQLKRLPPLWVFLKTVKAIRDTIFLSIGILLKEVQIDNFWKIDLAAT